MNEHDSLVKIENSYLADLKKSILDFYKDIDDEYNNIYRECENLYKKGCMEKGPKYLDESFYSKSGEMFGLAFVIRKLYRIFKDIIEEAEINK